MLIRFWQRRPFVTVDGILYRWYLEIEKKATKDANVCCSREIKYNTVTDLDVRIKVYKSNVPLHATNACPHA